MVRVDVEWSGTRGAAEVLETYSDVGAEPRVWYTVLLRPHLHVVVAVALPNIIIMVAADQT